MSQPINLSDITALSVDERIELVQAIWDSIAADADRNDAGHRHQARRVFRLRLLNGCWHLTPPESRRACGLWSACAPAATIARSATEFLVGARSFAQLDGATPGGCDVDHVRSLSPVRPSRDPDRRRRSTQRRARAS